MSYHGSAPSKISYDICKDPNLSALKCEKHLSSTQLRGTDTF